MDLPKFEEWFDQEVDNCGKNMEYKRAFWLWNNRDILKTGFDAAILAIKDKIKIDNILQE